MVSVETYSGEALTLGVRLGRAVEYGKQILASAWDNKGRLTAAVALAACGKDGESSDQQQNTFQTTSDLESGESQTVEGSFVEDGEIHCHYHEATMDFRVVVDHTATGVETKIVEIGMSDTDFLDAEGNPLDQVEVGHGQEIRFDFTNTRSTFTHNAMLGDEGGAGTPPVGGHHG